MDWLKPEMMRLLEDPPYGALSALARHLGITSASVSAWKYGTVSPSEEYWADIETFLGIPAGHIERAARGDLEPWEGDHPVPTWPVIRRSPAQPDPTVSQQLAELRAEVAALSLVVEELSRARLGDDPAAGTSRAARSTDATPRPARASTRRTRSTRSK